MRNKVSLEIVDGPLKGKKFEFAEHDTFIFGRAPDCHAQLADDPLVSRHHFILEVNPPLACLRDLGSLNATRVNNRKCGGRGKGETPEEGARRKYPGVDLNDGDRIRVGGTIMEVNIERAPVQQDESADVREEFARLIFEVNASKQKQAERFIEQQVGGYIVEKEIGRGGFGAVYLARRMKDNLRVALKVMLSQVAVDKEDVDQFLREIRNVSFLKHANIVPIFDFGSADGIFFFAMECCEGGSVDVLMARHQGRVPLALAKPIIFQSLQALAYAHSKGFVHRDLKPSNLLLSLGQNEVVAKLGDFGLAKSFEKAGMSGLTLTGKYAGTPCFVPPEQITNFKYVKPVSDVWSMGATIYNMLTGAFPYPFSAERDPIDVILNEDVISIRERDKAIPKSFAAVVDRALAKQIKDRYQTAEELLSAVKKASG